MDTFSDSVSTLNVINNRNNIKIWNLLVFIQLSPEQLLLYSSMRANGTNVDHYYSLVLLIVMNHRAVSVLPGGKHCTTEMSEVWLIGCGFQAHGYGFMGVWFHKHIGVVSQAYEGMVSQSCNSLSRGAS